MTRNKRENKNVKPIQSDIHQEQTTNKGNSCSKVFPIYCPRIIVSLFKKWENMKRSLIKIDKEFRKFWKRYVFQCILATIVIFIILLSLSIRDDAIIIASLGATTFIVFAMPKDISAKTRHIIGGHTVGLICGALCALMPHPVFLHHTIASSMICALSVGLSIFIMVVIDTEHPPAAGTALGVAIKGLSLNIAIAILASAIILSLIHYLFKNKLKDLT